MNSKILIIVNPISGRKKRDKYYNRIRYNLEMQGYDVNIKFTTKEHNANYIVKTFSEEYDLIIACGGDGTLNEVTQGLYDLKRQIPVGFIPCGTTNDYARSLNIPFNKFHLSKNIKNYKKVKIDLGVFNGKVFNYCATFGIFSKTSYMTSRKLKNAIGRFAYFINGAKEVFKFDKYKMKFSYDGKIIEDEFVFGSITNSSYLGGFHIFRREKVDLDEGKFDVLLIKEPKNLFDTLKIMIKVIRGNFKDNSIYHFRTDKLHIDSVDNCGWSIDGEYGGNSKDIDIVNEKKWSHYLVPKNKQ